VLRAVEAAGEVVRAQVAVGGGLGQDVPDDHNEGVGGGGGGLLPALVPKRRWKRRNCASTLVLVRPADQAHSVSSARSSLLPLRVLPERCLPADSLLPGTVRPTRPGAPQWGSGHVDADLGDDDLCGALTDPRDGRQRVVCGTNGRLASSMRVSRRAIMSVRWSMCSRCRVHISACWAPKRPAQANLRSGSCGASCRARTRPAACWVPELGHGV
jgi:hypothetical protein